MICRTTDAVKICTGEVGDIGDIASLANIVMRFFYNSPSEEGLGTKVPRTRRRGRNGDDLRLHREPSPKQQKKPKGSARVAVPEKRRTLPAGGFVILSYAAVPHVKELRG